MGYRVRLAAPGDIPGIIRVVRHTWDRAYARSIANHNRRQFLDRAYNTPAIREAIEDDCGWFYVAVCANRVVGLAQYRRRFDAQGELVRIYIHPDHQRRGIGRIFLARGAGAMAEAGLSLCYVSVEANNAPACEFYQRFGFHLHREYGSFLGDQLIRLAEYVVPIVDLLERARLSDTTTDPNLKD